MKTNLGDIRIFDESAVVEVRTKMLGLGLAFGFGPDVSMRMATLLSDLVRQLVMHREPGSLFIHVEHSGGCAVLGFRFLTSEAVCLSPRLREFFDEVLQVSDGQEIHEIALSRYLREFSGVLTSDFLDKQRERICLKSRVALLEELREKNKQLERYNAHLEELVRERTKELERANHRMQRDLNAGADYVSRLIPDPVDGQISIDWRYVPSEELGGDAMGYHWIDPDHLAIYLLDVTGHGIDSALLAVSIVNVIRGATLPETDFRHPSEVLAHLNDSFTMDRHGNKLFTIWYGVFHRPTHRLTWGGGGHPDALYYDDEANKPIRLASSGPLMGMIDWPHFETQSIVVNSPSRFYLFSDGVFEIHQKNQSEWTFDQFVMYMNQPVLNGESKMDALYQYVRQLSGKDQLTDDFSILEIRFDLPSGPTNHLGGRLF
ncbi:SpoIIE family protein phosphatase [bacterium]|nr:SpoIIE family protein phosphatase [bacterium]